MDKNDTPYDQVIQTAWPVAYGRTFTDIPYSQEFFDALLSVREQEKSDLFDESQIRTSLAPQFEARHKLLDKLIIESGIKQVLELASGLTTRGVIMTANPEVQYIETDLPKMAIEKRKIIQFLVLKEIISSRSNLHIETANALELESLKHATRSFSKKPIAVVNEGLLRYLNFDEKAQVARNVHTLLHEFGGIWITPDISMKSVIAREGENADRRISKISTLTGRDVSKNLFENVDEAQGFFEKLGFSVERHSLVEIADQLISPARLELSKEQVDEVINPVVVFVMRVQ